MFSTECASNVVTTASAADSNDFQQVKLETCRLFLKECHVLGKCIALSVALHKQTWRCQSYVLIPFVENVEVLQHLQACKPQATRLEAKKICRGEEPLALMPPVAMLSFASGGSEAGAFVLHPSC